MKRFLLSVLAVGLLIGTVLLSQPGNEPTGESALRAIGAMHPRLAPANDRVALSYQGAIWIVPAIGGVMRRLTSGEGFDAEPAWSPHGQRLAFVNSRNFSAGPLRLIIAEDRLTRCRGRGPFSPRTRSTAAPSGAT